MQVWAVYIRWLNEQAQYSDDIIRVAIKVCIYRKGFFRVGTRNCGNLIIDVVTTLTPVFVTFEAPPIAFFSFPAAPHTILGNWAYLCISLNWVFIHIVFICMLILFHLVYIVFLLSEKNVSNLWQTRICSQDEITPVGL